MCQSLGPQHPTQRRNYGFVLNSVHQIDGLAATGAYGLLQRTVYLGDYELIELKSWACLVQEALGARRVREVPLAVFKLTALFGDLLEVAHVRRFPMISFRLNNLLTDYLLDIAPLERAVGPLPYDLPSAVAITCRWLKSQQGTQ